MDAHGGTHTHVHTRVLKIFGVGKEMGDVARVRHDNRRWSHMLTVVEDNSLIRQRH